MLPERLQWGEAAAVACAHASVRRRSIFLQLRGSHSTARKTILYLKVFFGSSLGVVVFGGKIW